MSADGRESDVVVRSTMGSAKARVLPDPVGERTRTSTPASASGRTSSWMGNGSWIERATRAATTGGHAELAERSFGHGSTPFRVRDLPASKHPKEEREAHLTGRRYWRTVLTQ